MMNVLWVLLSGLFTGALVAAANYLALQKISKSERMRIRAEQERESIKITLPLRVQAYERLVLLCERISVNSLILRLQKPGMNAKSLQLEMIKTIRAEFDHNIAQQLYVSNKAWDAVKTSKEETIKAINIAASRVDDHAESMQLINVLFEIITRLEKMPTEVAVEIVKNEARAVI